MDVITFILNEENLRVVFIVAAIAAIGFWFEKRQDKKLNGLGETLRQEIHTLEQKVDGRFAALEQKVGERFTAFHKALKENDFAHVERTIKALTYSLEKNGFLKPEDKSFVDSHLNGG